MSSIEGIHVNGNTVSADIKIGDDLITVSAIRDGDYLTNATVNGLTVLNGSLTLEATLNQTSTDIWDCLLYTSFVPIAPLLWTI